ncbi:MAG TPA: pyridoxal-phosphate dependent enzyme [Thermomicrobiales bacterium]|nr:pyridoxal-phosphate dependent enzyme [Thermomicrobiales bacterium]
MARAERRLSLDRIEAAVGRIDPVFLDTPQFMPEALGEALGLNVALKIETMNPIRSFKGRGASLLVARADPAQPLMCASAGNFGQAMAYACRAAGIPLVIYAATTANPLKVERMRALGARVVLHGEDFDGAKDEARRVAAREGIRFVEDSRDLEPSEGAGTMALEWLRFSQPLDALVVPLGNGAMLAGIATVMTARSPQTRLVAVQAVGAPAMTESLQTGRRVAHERIDTIADGIGVRTPVPEALDDLRGLVDEFLLVDDATIVRAMRLIHRHVAAVAEPSGAVGVAALLAYPERFRRGLTGTILCGGNLTPAQMREWLGEEGDRG